MFKLGVYADLVHPGTDGRHRLPIIRHQALLHPPQLVAGGAPCVDRERANVIERRPKPREWLLGHGRLYTYLYMACAPAGIMMDACRTTFLSRCSHMKKTSFLLKLRP